MINNIKKTTEEFINESKKKFGDKFDYSKTNYITKKIKVCITCKKHGDFFILPHNHLVGNGGCKTCQSYSTEEFVNKSKKKFGDKFDYSKTKYNGTKNKVCITCKKHGDFYILPYNHLSGKGGCPKCRSYTTEEYISALKSIYGDKFDYSKTKYINKNTKICITCKKHGDFFTWPNYLKLRNGGCPKCSLPKGEEIIALFLKHNHILFENQKKFNDLKDKSYLKYDFYLPEKNTLIEFNGKQHYKEIAFFGGRKKFLKQKHHDWLKRKYAIKNNIKLLIIKYDDNISEILSSLI